MRFTIFIKEICYQKFKWWLRIKIKNEIKSKIITQGRNFDFFSLRAIYICIMLYAIYLYFILNGLEDYLFSKNNISTFWIYCLDKNIEY